MNSDERNIEMVSKYSSRSTWRSMRMGKAISIFVLVVLCVGSIFLSFTIGVSIGKHQFSRLADQGLSAVYSREVPEKFTDDIDFQPFWDAWTLLEQRHVNNTQSDNNEQDSESKLGQDRVWGAISGLTASYEDPFTTFLPPESKELFESDIKGEFTGVGMEIGSRDDLLTVISPLPKTPAARAGILPKDIISKIDGVDSLNMSTEQAVKLIRGPKGESVILTVIRQGVSAPLDITIVRDVINIPTIETGAVEDVFVIKLYSFGAKAPAEFQLALEEFIDSGKESLLIDLRNNPGGYLEAAVQISSWFLEKGQTVVVEDYGNNLPQKKHDAYSLRISRNNQDINMVILINEGSASASEIVAGALRDHNKAILVGRTTFGKGSVQELFNLTTDTSLKITVAKWSTPDGNNINDDGITPDIVLPEIDRDAAPIEEQGSTYNQDLLQDTEILQAVKVLQHPDFQSLFDSIDEEYKESFINKSK